MTYAYLPPDEETVALVARWLYDAFGSRQPDGSPERTLAEVRERVGSERVPLCVVAYLDGKPAGTFSITDDDMKTRPEFKPWLADLVVAPALRGRGIGSAMFRQAEREFKKLGAPTGYLFTWDHEGLYTRLGWQTFLVEQYRADRVAVMKREF